MGSVYIPVFQQRVYPRQALHDWSLGLHQKPANQFPVSVAITGVEKRVTSINDLLAAASLIASASSLPQFINRNLAGRGGVHLLGHPPQELASFDRFAINRQINGLGIFHGHQVTQNTRAIVNMNMV